MRSLIFKYCMNFKKRSITCLTALTFFLASSFFGVLPAKAAGSLYVSAPASVRVGDTITITVNVNTGGDSANAFKATFSYPAGSLEGLSGSYADSVCTLPITQPNPKSGSASISCGTPSGFSGTGNIATMSFRALAAGSVSLGLSGCNVLANDGLGTDITGSCSGRSLSIEAAAVASPSPSVAPVNSPSPSPSASTKPKTSTTPKVTTSQSPKNAETPKTAPSANAEQPTPPPVQAITEESPTPTPSESPEASSENTDTASSQKRSIWQALKDNLAALKNLKTAGSQISSLIAVLLILLPILALILAIVYMLYRLYILERRRRRTLDRLFEMELSEFAALEGKLDVLSTKGAKGREEYQDEFSKAKERILRQLRPDFNKPVSSGSRIEAAVVGKSDDNKDEAKEENKKVAPEAPAA